jgi:predicted TIM-barrel fold metal-dependent hydrolase
MSGVLKKYVPQRTVNVHAHLISPAWYAAAAPTAAWESTDAERAYFTHYVAMRQELTAARHVEMTDEQRAEYKEREAARANAQTLAEQATYFLTEMDEAGIDLMVNLTMDHSEFPGFRGRMYSVPFEQILEECAALKELHPGRFEMFCGIDPRRGRAGVPLFERAVKEYGALGLGEMISTQWRTMPTDRELCYPYYEKAVELGVPLMQDATMDLGFSEPSLFEQLAHDFPELQICLGGAGAGVPPVTSPEGSPMAAHDRMLQLAEQFENLWLDLDDWQMRDFGGLDTYADFLQRALAGPARERIMFGSDYPVFNFMYTEEDWVSQVLDRLVEVLSTEDLELFFSTNAMRFCGLLESAER